MFVGVSLLLRKLPSPNIREKCFAISRNSRTSRAFVCPLLSSSYSELELKMVIIECVQVSQSCVVNNMLLSSPWRWPKCSTNILSQLNSKYYFAALPICLSFYPVLLFLRFLHIMSHVVLGPFFTGLLLFLNRCPIFRLLFVVVFPLPDLLKFFDIS